MKTEKIITFWRFGYFKLFEYDELDTEYVETKNGEEQEWHKIFWRFYWRFG